MKYIKHFNESLDIKEIDDYFLEIYDEFPDVKIKQMSDTLITIDLGIYAPNMNDITEPDALDKISEFYSKISIFWKLLKESIIRLEFDKYVSINMNYSLDYKYPMVSMTITDSVSSDVDKNLFVEYGDSSNYPVEFSINENKLKSILKYNGLTFDKLEVGYIDEYWSIKINVKEDISYNTTCLGTDIYNIFSKIDNFFDLFSHGKVIFLRLGDDYGSEDIKYIKK